MTVDFRALPVVAGPATAFWVCFNGGGSSLILRLEADEAALLRRCEEGGECEALAWSCWWATASLLALPDPPCDDLPPPSLLSVGISTSLPSFLALIDEDEDDVDELALDFGLFLLS